MTHLDQSDSHVLRIKSAPLARRMGYCATCSCGWSSRNVSNLRKAEFERDFHERVEAIKSEARVAA